MSTVFRAVVLAAALLFGFAAAAVAVCDCDMGAFKPLEEAAPAFAEKIKAAAVADDFLVPSERDAITRLTEWLNGNRWARVGEFLDALSERDAETLLAAAEKGELTSSEFAPVMAAGGGAFGLPFRGEMFVIQGNGGTISHQKDTNNEFAWDFIVMRRGAMLAGNSAKNKSYFTWGMEALSPADGVVVRAVDGNEDHPPMTTKLNKPNFVIVDHGGGAQSLHYHLMKGSVAVKEGDRVARGQKLGLMGDSGISMFPHLHYEVDRLDAEGKRQPAESRFAVYFARGASETEYRLAVNAAPREKEYVIDVDGYLDMLAAKRADVNGE